MDGLKEATTPTIVIRCLSQSAPCYLANATRLVVSIQGSSGKIVTKENNTYSPDDLAVEGQDIIFYLTQEETLRLGPGRAFAEVTFAFEDGTVLKSNTMQLKPIQPAVRKELT